MEKDDKQQFRCQGDCLNCRAINDRKQQWWYCAAQFSYNTSRMIQAMQETINIMSGTIEELKAKVDAIQNNEAVVFAPNEEISEKPITPIAQEGDGAKK